MPARLVVWVEGVSDRLFFEAVIQPRLETRYSQVLVKEYSEKRTALVNNLLRTMTHDGFDRLFIADLDYAPCVTSRKEKVKVHYPEIRDREIIVVSAEIESWYLAGLTPEGSTALNISPPSSTDRLTKEDLDRIRPPRFDSPIPFLLELLTYFEPAITCQRNRSFAYLPHAPLTAYHA
jgi:hypothetical protein